MDKIDIKDFRLPDDDPRCYYIFAVVTETPKYDFDYYSQPAWRRFLNRLLGIAPAYQYFHVGQIVICDTDEHGRSPRETPWGGKPGKHDCIVEKFTDLAKTIQCAKDTINRRSNG